MLQVRAIVDLQVSEPQPHALPVQLEAPQEGFQSPGGLGHAVVQERAPQVGNSVLPDHHEPQVDNFAQADDV